MAREGPCNAPGEAAASESPPTDAGSARVFVGIKLAPEIACELVGIAKELKNAAVRPVSADDVHLTLVPPWQEDCIGKATEMLRRITAGFNPFALVVEHVGFGPDPRRPRLLWADLCTRQRVGSPARGADGGLCARRPTALSASPDAGAHSGKRPSHRPRASYRSASRIQAID